MSVALLLPMAASTHVPTPLAPTHVNVALDSGSMLIEEPAQVSTEPWLCDSYSFMLVQRYMSVMKASTSVSKSVPTPWGPTRAHAVLDTLSPAMDLAA